MDDMFYQGMWHLFNTIGRNGLIKLSKESFVAEYIKEMLSNIESGDYEAYRMTIRDMVDDLIYYWESSEDADRYIDDEIKWDEVIAEQFSAR